MSKGSGSAGRTQNKVKSNQVSAEEYRGIRNEVLSVLPPNPAERYVKAANTVKARDVSISALNKGDYVIANARVWEVTSSNNKSQVSLARTVFEPQLNGLRPTLERARFTESDSISGGVRFTRISGRGVSTLREANEEKSKIWWEGI